MPRFFYPLPLPGDHELTLPEGAARHIQVLRLQPGQAVTLFNGEGGEYTAVIEHMGRSEVRVRVGAHDPIERETPRAVHLAVGMPANERMDWLVEKAAELGVASIQPLLTERSVLRPTGDRALKKHAHWQAVAVAACEQCGRNRVPAIHAPQTFVHWSAQPMTVAQRWVLSLQADAQALGRGAGDAPVLLLSGPEGGLAAGEEAAARAQGFVPATLGARTLRAETAPLAALVALTVAT